MKQLLATNMIKFKLQVFVRLDFGRLVFHGRSTSNFEVKQFNWINDQPSFLKAS